MSSYIAQPLDASDPVVVTSAMQAALTGYQPVDSDLTAIAALSTTSYGRNLLTLANQAALQSAVGSVATLTTARAIYGNNFDGSAALTQIIASTFGGTGNGFAKFSGPTTAERTKTLRDASDTILELGGSYTPTGTWTNLTCVTPTLGVASATSLAIAGTGNLTQGTTSNIYNETSQNQVYFNYSNGNGVAIRGTTSPRIYMLGVGGPAGAAGTGLLAWANTTLDGSPSSTISQQSAGVVQIGTTAANALGSIACANVTASGTLTASGTGTHTFGTTNTVTMAAGVLTASAGLKAGTGSTLIKLLSATATLDFGSVAANSFADLTITVTGAALGDTVSIGVPNGSLLNDISFFGWVSATNTVTVRCSNVSSTTARDPASGTFRATVTQF